VSIITRGRRVGINQTVLDQADFFQGNGFTRQLGLTVADVTGIVFHNNVIQPWTLTDGAPITDSLVRSGLVYFHEMTGTSGYYSLRMRPNALGSWRLLLTYGAGQQIAAQDYDVSAESPTAPSSLKASFTNR
jgi:hypothetical protein